MTEFPTLKQTTLRELHVSRCKVAFLERTSINRIRLQVRPLTYRQLVKDHLNDYQGLGLTVADELGRVKSLVENSSECVLLTETEFCLSLLRVSMAEPPSTTAQTSFLSSLLRLPHLQVPVLFELPRPGIATELLTPQELDDRVFRYGGLLES